MKVRGWTATVLTVAACALAACGDDGGGNGDGGGGGGTTTAGEAVSGREVFLSNGCANCHRLQAVGASGSMGPDLDQLRPDAATVAAKVREGGGGMPSFGDDLSDEQIEAVAQFVSSEAGR